MKVDEAAKQAEALLLDVLANKCLAANASVKHPLDPGGAVHHGIQAEIGFGQRGKAGYLGLPGNTEV